MEIAVDTNSTGRGDAGQTLPLVLAFLAGFGFLIAVLLGGVEVNLKTTTVVRSRTERVYAADAGIEYGLKRLAIDPTSCPSETPSSLPSQMTNGRTVTLTCQVKTSSSNEETPGGAGWAAIVTGNLSAQGGGTATISGPTYVKGSIGSIHNTQGSVSQFFTNCPGGHTAPAGLTVDPHPPYSWQCTTAATPDPPHTLPPAPIVLNPVSKPSVPCQVFFPGKYTTAPSLATNNYFVSGVYYFEDIGNWSLGTGQKIYGGTNAADTTRLTPNPCNYPDSTAGSGGTGSGVEWIFGGTSSISFKNNDDIELYTRVPGPAEPDSVTKHISFAAVCDPARDTDHVPPCPVPAGYKASTVGTVFDSSGGHPDTAIHGLFYAPTADVSLYGPNALTVVHNGIVSHDLEIKLSGTAGPDPIISVDTSSTNKRFAVLTATATSSGEADIVATALVEIRNNTNPATIAVHSWRTG